MKYVTIIKGSNQTVVDITNFKKLYEPNGWRIDETKQPIDSGQSDENILNIIKINNTKRVVFNDDLFYSEIKRS